MPDSLPHRLSVALAAAAAASAFAAVPALATEGPSAPPPAAPMTGAVGPLGIAPLTPAPTARSSRVISSVRLIPKRVQRGRRAKLRISLSTPSRLRVVMRRSASGHKIRAINVPAGKRTVTLRLPKRTDGHALRRGRYRIGIVSIDAQGVPSTPIVRTLVVRAAR